MKSSAEERARVEALIAKWWKREDYSDAEKQAIEDQLRLKFGVTKPK